MNLGVASCRAPLVLQLNSDVEARDDFLAPLRRRARRRSAPRGAESRRQHLSSLRPRALREARRLRRVESPLGLRVPDPPQRLRRGRAASTRRSGSATSRTPTSRAASCAPGTGSACTRTRRCTTRATARSRCDPSDARCSRRTALRYHERWPAARRQVLLATRSARGSELPRVARRRSVGRARRRRRHLVGESRVAARTARARHARRSDGRRCAARAGCASSAAIRSSASPSCGCRTTCPRFPRRAAARSRAQRRDRDETSARCA